jgi:ArsR family transcriptional regulator, arsenate/arsenite/antimonite-responsive transcriptional repressor
VYLKGCLTVELPSDDVKNLGKLFQAMADPTRRKILEMLRAGDLSAGAIAEAFNMTKPAISHHLSVLKEAGLATERRQGQHVIYSLQTDSIVEAWDGFLGKLCAKKRKRKGAT